MAIEGRWINYASMYIVHCAHYIAKKLHPSIHPSISHFSIPAGPVQDHRNPEPILEGTSARLTVELPGKKCHLTLLVSSVFYL